MVRSGFGVFLAQPLLSNFEQVYFAPNLPTRLNFAATDIAALGLKYPMTNDDILKLFGRPLSPWDTRSSIPITGILTACSGPWTCSAS